ncbi:MAG: group I intron-associated PD-(D/E)XK endonuclease [Acidobacteriota bacterium]|nr:group I intron-associated PD-(D/E)XK endonuclease [Acidobacteriota bacterium]
MRTREKGNLTEAKILAALVAAGYLVSVPFGEGHKYDFIIDDSVNLRRVQCKTGRVKKAVLLFNSYSQSGNGATKQGYYGLADVFAVLNPESGEVYLVPVENFGTTGVTLRLMPTLSGQVQNINWAVDYLLTPLRNVD